jgi:hypothetical protein
LLCESLGRRLKRLLLLVERVVHGDAPRGNSLNSSAKSNKC